MNRLIIQTSAPTLDAIHSGQARFINRLRDGLHQQGWAVQTRVQRRRDAVFDRFDGAYHLHEIAGASGACGLNFRRAYFYPWWTFDYPDQRYGGRIGSFTYHAGDIDLRAARAFYAAMQREYLVEFERGTGDGPALVPLQAALNRQRAWQYTNLVGMIQHIRTQDPSRRIILKPHPKIRYSTAETALLRQLCADPMITVVEAPMATLLGHAAYVATHNSAAAFEAMVLGIPAILFARADFHHICPVVKSPADAAAAFARLRHEKPDFVRYLYWFLALNCVHAGRDDTFAQIARQLADCGWPVRPALDL